MKYDVKDFTIDEKIRLLAAKDRWHTADFGGRLYEVLVSDGPVGLRTIESEENGVLKYSAAVAFPSTQILGQTWDTSKAYRMGEVLADECIERGVDVLLAPGINVKRLPICGRNFEYVSEDPYLSGIFGREYIKGVQDHHVGTSLKHYCANNQEYSRYSQSSEVDERTLREIYTYNFKIALEAKPWTVMSSYNLVNGVKMSAHKKLYTMLRCELGFDGLIMSDWSAVDDHAACVLAGLDLEMPYSEAGYQNLKAAVEEGRVTEEELDRRVEVVLRFIELCERESKKRKVETTLDERIELTEKIAEEGIVLLKNNGVLPIKDGASVAVSGQGAALSMSGAGSSRVNLEREAANLFDELSLLLPNSEIYPSLSQRGFSHQGFFSHAINAAYGKDVNIVCVHQIDTEGHDRDSIRLESWQENFILEMARKNPNTVVVLYHGSVIDMTAWEDKVAAIVSAGYPGERGNAAVAKILAGVVNPSGKTTETYPETLDDCLAMHCMRDYNCSLYSDGLLVGYRWYDTAKYMGKGDTARVKYPFGHGLSYSSFEYSGLNLSLGDEDITVEFDVKNTSEMDGKEVAQVYFRDPVSTVFRPYKELCGFEKKLIKAGESEHYTVKVPKEYLAFYSTSEDSWVLESGTFEILVGASAEDIRLKGNINI